MVKYFKKIGIIVCVAFISLAFGLVFTACDFGGSKNTTNNENVVTNPNDTTNQKTDKQIVTEVITEVGQSLTDKKTVSKTDEEISGNSKYGIAYSSYSDYVKSDNVFDITKGYYGLSMGLFLTFINDIPTFDVNKTLKFSYYVEPSYNSSNSSYTSGGQMDHLYRVQFDEDTKVITIYAKYNNDIDWGDYEDAEEDRENHTNINYYKTEVSLNSDYTVKNVDIIMYQEIIYGQSNTESSLSTIELSYSNKNNVQNVAEILMPYGSVDGSFHNVDFAKGKAFITTLSSESTEANYLSIKNYVENKIDEDSLKQEVAVALVVSNGTINGDKNIEVNAMKAAGVGGF